MSGRLIALALAFTSLIAGCGAAEDATEPQSDAAAQPAAATASALGEVGEVGGTVTYTGAKTGTVKFAIYKTLPPNGPPVAFAAYPAAKLPLSYEINTPAGEYKLLCFLDVVDEGFVPAAGDPGAAPKDVVIPSGGTAAADVVLPQ